MQPVPAPPADLLQRLASPVHVDHAGLAGDLAAALRHLLEVDLDSEAGRWRQDRKQAQGTARSLLHRLEG